MTSQKQREIAFKSPRQIFDANYASKVNIMEPEIQRESTDVD